MQVEIDPTVLDEAGEEPDAKKASGRKRAKQQASEAKSALTDVRVDLSMEKLATQLTAVDKLLTQLMAVLGEREDTAQRREKERQDSAAALDAHRAQFEKSVLDRFSRIENMLIIAPPEVSRMNLQRLTFVAGAIVGLALRALWAAIAG